MEKIIGIVLGSIILIYFTGCAQLIGIKSYKTKDTEILFTTGFDIGASLNQVDTVNNQRGIKPN